MYPPKHMTGNNLVLHKALPWIMYREKNNFADHHHNQVTKDGQYFPTLIFLENIITDIVTSLRWFEALYTWSPGRPVQSNTVSILNFSGKHSVTLHLVCGVSIYKCPPVSTGRYSITHLSELEQCVVNELANYQTGSKLFKPSFYQLSLPFQPLCHSILWNP